ncbi:MAG: hypothetical protein CBC29_10025 [Methylococcaceae bacterium TMED69]|nr:MAG: hypothetical protein CBC29_10025 [Methylococcaceae bacterium TMED69]
MKITLCVKGYKKILACLRSKLPKDIVEECAPEKTDEAALKSDVLIPVIAPITQDILASKSLKLVQQFGVGLDTVDIEAANKNKIFVANVPSGGTGNAESVAELTIGYMIMLSRWINDAQSWFRDKKFGAPLGSNIWKSTVAIIGYGDIGKALQRRLSGFEAKTIGVFRDQNSLSKAIQKPDRSITFDQLPELIGTADFIIVTVSGGEANYNLINKNLFRLMKKSAFLINVSRGKTVSYADLLDALDKKTIAGAALDVFWSEPFDPNDKLFNYNVIATPHIGGATDLSLDGISQEVANNINRVRKGLKPNNLATSFLP